MKCLVPSYYLCHTFLVFSYAILRRHLIQCGNGDFFSQTGKMTEDWLTREQEIWVVAFIIYFMKCRKVVTIQQLADMTFFYGKLAAAVSLFMASKTFGSAYITVLISSLLFIRPRRFEDVACAGASPSAAARPLCRGAPHRAVGRRHRRPS